MIGDASGAYKVARRAARDLDVTVRDLPIAHDKQHRAPIEQFQAEYATDADVAAHVRSSLRQP